MRKVKVRWQLVLYDIIVMLVIYGLSMLVVTQFGDAAGVLRLVGIIAVVVFATRFACNVYGQIWRYGGIQCYIRLIGADVLAFIILIGIVFCCPAVKVVSCSRLIAMASIYLLATLTMRMMYRYAFKYGNVNTRLGRFLLTLLRIFAGKDVVGERSAEMGKTYVAIIGAGRVGVSLAEELIINQSGEYIPHCFVDIDRDKVGREILGLPVLQEDDQVFEKFEKLIVREVIFALPDGADVKRLYDYYSEAGYRIKVYDYSLMEAPGSKRQLREFDIEELLFRKPVRVYSERSKEYYRDKVILVTGGGGSIGSEICRQLAEMAPKRIVILDIYENGAYDV
ncbi:MAG: polysaccharide biosynthesis protein, partial [Oscillospiraceae bacterium]|nr:polysaccharide biosynthesis protein [Oscillospiraceae bacterium]